MMKLQRWGNGEEYPEVFSYRHSNLWNHMRAGDAGAVRAFLEKESQWLGYYYFGKSLLHKAAEWDNPENLAVLVDLGIDVNTPEEEYPWGALYTAVTSGHVRSACWLLEHGATPRYEFRGLTFSYGALSSAAFGNFEMLKLLVHHGAPVDILVDDPPRGLLTAAIDGRHKEIADYLRSKGALTDEEIKRRKGQK